VAASTPELAPSLRAGEITYRFEALNRASYVRWARRTMPSLEHNAIVEMFRDNPELAPHLLSTLFHVDVPTHATTAVVESSLDQLVPVEFRADLVLELRSAAGRTLLAIVLEVQRDEDPDKKYSWPVYVAVVRARKRCDTVVLVVAPDTPVAAWAAEKIDLGLRRSSVEPLVLGPEIVPAISDPVAAEQEIELAVLSAMAHGNGPNGLAVVHAALVALGRLDRLDREHAAVYAQIIWRVLREPVRRALEVLVMERRTEGETPFPPFMQAIYDRARHDARVEVAARDVLAVLRVRGIAVPDAVRERVLAEKDPDRLERWLERAILAATAAEVLDEPS
jgi:hypothetical protein